MMFDGLDLTIRIAIYALTALNLPAHLSHEWNRSLLKAFLLELQLPESHFEAFFPLTKTASEAEEVLLATSIESLSSVFLQMIDNSGLDRFDLFISVSIYLRFSNRFDARGRVLIRNLMALSSQSRSLRSSIDLSIQAELQLARANASQNAVILKESEKVPQSSAMRYLKIGSAAVLTGAVLAVTGGLAAPAIALALTTMGGATVAASMSTAAMAVLFGAAGAGLATYKMDKRTSGITEFCIENHPNKDQVGIGSTVILMVSGFMGHGEDYKRIFGVMPANIGFKERLVRFYQRYDLQRINCAEREAIMFDENPQKEPFLKKLRRKYGRDPMNHEDLTGPLTDQESQYLKQAQRAMKDANAKSDSESESEREKSGELRGPSGIGSKVSDALEVEPNFNSLLARYKAVVRRNVALALDHAIAVKSDNGKSSEVSASSSKPSSSTATTVSNTNKNSTSSSSSAAAATKMTVNDIKKPSNTNDNQHNLPTKKVDTAFRTALACDKTVPRSSTSHSSSDEIPSNTYISCVTARPFTYNAQQEEFESTSAIATRSIPSPPVNTSSSSSWNLSSLSPLSYMPSMKSGMFHHSTPDSQLVTKEKEIADRKKEIDDVAEKKKENYISLLELYWNWSEYSLSPTFDLHLLRWESQLQLDVGKSIVSAWLQLGKTAAQDVAIKTFFSALSMAALLPTVALTITNMMYSLWSLAILRADEAGVELARALSLRPPGSTPVTLVGYSLGGRVIFSCLNALADMQFGPQHSKPKPDDALKPLATEVKIGEKQNQSTTQPKYSDVLKDELESDDNDDDDGYVHSPLDELTEDNLNDEKEDELKEGRDLCGIVMDVVILGAPICLTSRKWMRARKMTAGRLINGYSRRDLVLAISYRCQTLKGRIAGIAPVPMKTCAGVENRNFSSIIASHLDYCANMKDILEALDLTAPSGCDSDEQLVPKKVSGRIGDGILILKESMSAANILYGVM